MIGQISFWDREVPTARLLQEDGSSLRVFGHTMDGWEADEDVAGGAAEERPEWLTAVEREARSVRQGACGKCEARSVRQAA